MSEIMGYRFAVLFSGLPCSGKSTVAALLSKQLDNCQLISSSTLRSEHKLDDIHSVTQRMILFGLVGKVINEQSAKGINRIVVDTNLFQCDTRKGLFKQLDELKYNIVFFSLLATETDIMERLTKKFTYDTFYINKGFKPDDVVQFVESRMDPLSETEMKSIKVLIQYNTSINIMTVDLIDAIHKNLAEYICGLFTSSGRISWNSIQIKARGVG